MSGPEFFQTGMGRRYYESTLPALVKEMERLANAAERLVALLESRTQEGRAEAPSAGAAGAEPSRPAKEMSP
jgi:hypothetical protein